MKPSTAAFLNKSESTHHLHTRYGDFITKNGLQDQHPDFYSLINENLRNHASMSAIAAGHPRGNKGKYGKIDHIRMLGRPMFARSILDEWFDLHYAPKLLAMAA